jgi:hypothetical protein
MQHRRAFLVAALLLAPWAGTLAAGPSAPVTADIGKEKAEPGRAEWAHALAALGRGESLLVQARQFGPREPDLKREAYTRAEAAFQEALGWIDAYLLIRPEPRTVVEETMARIRRGLYECHKSKPLQLS